MEALVEIEVKGAPLVERLSDVVGEQILADCRQLLDEHTTRGGALEMPIRAVFIAGRKL